MFLNILLEVIIITILIGGSYYGYKRGFFRLAAKPTRLILCIALSFSFCKIIGNLVVAPVLISGLDAGISDYILPAVRAISTVIAFVILFFLTRLVLSLVISIADRFLDSGIVGRVNRSLGVILAGSLAFIGAICFASIADYLLDLEIFDDSDLAKDFSGGLIYRLLLMVSPIGL